ncbi:sirohydrochlorin chelatase [Candidatus Mycobacterium methanotrophicum]|uniref:Sirohydrochlorin chelatase n=1 Tax=Candidatus Mycobacterium methanotrophicum TaxID=2943498 RepID=A0ABY4QUE8_9MYCO|nr:CbiX/SirB N-terminal domain-containing protein [Candidatus Mycobacterium methanotrophicum]UQX13510.1 sirohydrochlorin chelatase [Candidatus Mycobacterium methanotrophicum]
MTTLLVAHGTRNPRGVRMIGDLAAAMAGVLNETVRVAFVDVLDPAPADLLGTLHDEPIVLVPALLSSGYHVRCDLPRHVAASGHPAVTVTPALGPSSELARAMLDRLLEAGWRRDDHVVLAAAGTSDPHAQGEVRAAAAMLSALVGERVSIAFAAPCRDGSGYPSVPDAVARARRLGARRVAVASYLLADGVFQGQLHDADADAVGAPLGLHPAVLRLACRRRRHAGLPVPAHA